MPEKEPRMIESVRNGIVTAIKVSRRLNSAVVSDLPKNLKPHDGKPTVEKQIEQLTAREIEVLQLVAEGKLNKQAAAELGISTKIIEKHRHQLTSKPGVHGTSALTHFAIYAGIIEGDPQMVMG